MQSTRPLGYHYATCGVVTGSLDLETYHLFRAKKQSHNEPTDADWTDHNWSPSEGGGRITQSRVLCCENCTGPDCILCSFEQELIQIGYHERQAARTENRFNQEWGKLYSKNGKKNKIQNREIMQKHPDQVTFVNSKQDFEDGKCQEGTRNKDKKNLGKAKGTDGKKQESVTYEDGKGESKYGKVQDGTGSKYENKLGNSKEIENKKPDSVSSEDGSNRSRPRKKDGKSQNTLASKDGKNQDGTRSKHGKNVTKSKKADGNRENILRYEYGKGQYNTRSKDEMSLDQSVVRDLKKKETPNGTDNKTKTMSRCNQKISYDSTDSKCNPNKDVRIVSSISENRVCFNAAIPNAYTPVPFNVSSKPFLLQISHALELDYPIIVGKKDGRNKVEAAEEISNCNALWKVDSKGKVIHNVAIGSTRNLQKSRTSANSMTQFTSPSNEPGCEFYLSDGSTPKVMSPSQDPSPISDEPTPKNSMCKLVNPNPDQSDAEQDVDLPDHMIQNFSAQSSANSSREHSRADTSEQELYFSDDDETDEEMQMFYVDGNENYMPVKQSFKSDGSGRESPESATTEETAFFSLGSFFRRKCSLNQNSSSSLKSLDEVGLQKSKRKLSLTTRDRRTPSYRINSAPSEFPSLEPGCNQNMNNDQSEDQLDQWNKVVVSSCPLGAAARRRLLTMFQKNRKIPRTSSAVEASTCNSLETSPTKFQQTSMPASPQTTPPHCPGVTLRSVQSSPGFNHWSPVKSRLTPQLPYAAAIADMTPSPAGNLSMFSPYPVLPGVPEKDKGAWGVGNEDEDSD